MVGRTVKLQDAQAARTGKLLTPAGETSMAGRDQHSLGSWRRIPLVKVRPKVAVGGAADAPLQAGHYRHPVRSSRHRTDLDPSDVETLPPT